MEENKIRILNRITSNIMSEEETLNYIEDSLNFISNSLSRTLGPYGSTTIIQDRLLQHTMSKDGYTVLNRIFIKEDLPRTVLDIIKTVSKKLVRTVGDGSTSSIIVASKLFNEIKNLSKRYNVAPKDIVDLLNECSTIFSDNIRKHATKITDENKEKLRDIATISVNNDTTSGDLIYEIYEKIGRFGFINLENGLYEKDYYEITSGLEIPRGYLTFTFSNKEDKKTCEFEEPLVFMCNDILGEKDLPILSELIGNICGTYGQSLVLVSKGYDNIVKTFFLENRMANKSLNFCPIDIAFDSNPAANKFFDLATALGAEPWDKMSGEKIESFDIKRLGRCKKSVITDMNSKFVGVMGNPEKIKERVAVLIEEHDEMSRIEDHIERDEEIYLLKKRIASLQNAMAVLYVGGNSETEKTTRKYLLEDAIYACQSSMENGYIVGGNLMLPRIISREKEEITKILLDKFNLKEVFIKDFLNSIYISFLHSYETVLTNYSDDIFEVYNSDNGEMSLNEIIEKCINEDIIYNLKKKMLETNEETMIINSCETDIEIIKASFSIIGLLVTSNQFISINTL